MRRASAFILSFACTFVVPVSVADAQDIGGSAEARKTRNPHASSATSIDAGKTTYTRSCAGCHGVGAKGAGKSAPKTMTVPSDLTDTKWDRGATDGEIFAVIRHGAGPKFEMRANKILKDDEIWDVVNYLRSLGPPAKK